MTISNENVKWTLTFYNQSRWIHIFTKRQHVKQALIFHQEKKPFQGYGWKPIVAVAQGGI